MDRLRRSVLVYTALLTTVACESPLGPRRSDSELTSLPRDLAAGEVQLIQASNSFAFDILRETVRRDTARNVFLSPLSASMALGMTLNGARGATLDGMRTALGFGSASLAAINGSYRSLIDLLLSLDPNVDMRLANSIWAREGYPFHDEFLQTNRQYFDAKVAVLDFNSPGAAPTINSWVDANTGGKIRQIVPDPLPADVVMYLINAIYFKGSWREAFDVTRTSDGLFTLAPGVTVPARLMNRRGLIRHHHDSSRNVDVVELPYGRGAYVMTIVVPGAATDVDAIIAGLDAQRWQQWTGALEEKDLELSLPKFRIEYETVMNEPLIALGMAAAFGRAPGTDFTGMSPRGTELFIGQVKQKTFVDVNEQGTEAAAVTAVAIFDSAPPSVRVDRPFLVALRERFSGTIIFLGRIGQPKTP